MSLYTMVSRGVGGRLAQRGGSSSIEADKTEGRISAVRLPGASMRVLEAGLALTAIATAILIGIGH